MKGDNSLQGEAKGASIWISSQRKHFAARKSAPVAAPPAYNYGSDSSDDSDSDSDSDSSGESDSSDDELSETSENERYQ